jgi:GT2 family glycosyltransferase
MKDNHISSQKLSIIIVTYKRNNDLQALLWSILSQTVDKKDYEILIIDNSADAQAKPIIQQYTTLPIQYFHNPKNGVSIWRNIWIKHAFSDFCLFLDDDNELQNTDIIRHIIQQDVVKLKRENNIAGINYKNTLWDGKTWYYHISALITCGTLIRRKYLEKIGNFNEHMLCYFEDTDVSIRLLKYGYDLIENGYIYISFIKKVKNVKALEIIYSI